MGFRQALVDTQIRTISAGLTEMASLILGEYSGRLFWGQVRLCHHIHSELTEGSICLQKASGHVYAPHLAGGQGLVSGFTFNFDTETHGIINHVDRYSIHYPSITAT